MSSGKPLRTRRADAGSLLNPALVPTPLADGQDRSAIAIEATVASRGRVATVVGALTALGVRLGVLWMLGRLAPRVLGRHLTAFCLRMGVLWIKIAQLLSMRVDLLPPEVVEELSTLQDRAAGFAGDLAIRAIEADLDAPLDRVFTDFETVPFAAASIAQVHRARLRENGVTVAIKVRRPGIERTFADDMRVLRGIVRVLEALSIKPHFGWHEMLWEAEAIIREELDYRIEATNQRRLRRALRRHGVYVPKVFSRYCGTRILVMEYVPGVLMSDYLRVARTDRPRLEAWLAENDVNPVAVGKRLLSSYLRQLLEDNLFHSDLHPGNLMLLREGHFALLDCGSLGTSEREFLRRYELYVESFIGGRHATAADVFLLFARHLPPVDLAGIKQELIEALDAWLTRSRATALPFEERSASLLTDELVRILDAHGITITWTFLRIGRAWTTMDASLRELAPRRDWRPIIARYFRRKERRDGARALRALSGSAGAIAPLDVPRLLYERGLFRGTVVRRLAQVFEGSTTVAAQFVADAFKWLARGHALAGALLALVFLSQHAAAVTIDIPWGRWAEGAPRLDLQVWLLVFIVLVHGWRSSRHLQRRFSARQVAGDD